QNPKSRRRLNIFLRTTIQILLNVINIGVCFLAILVPLKTIIGVMQCVKVAVLCFIWNVWEQKPIDRERDIILLFLMNRMENKRVFYNVDDVVVAGRTA